MNRLASVFAAAFVALRRAEPLRRDQGTLAPPAVPTRFMAPMRVQNGRTLRAVAIGGRPRGIDNVYSSAIMRIMKVRKNITLSPQAILRGERTAKQRGSNLSALIERHLLSLGEDVGESEHYCARHRPVPRPGDARYDYLIRKHR